MTNLMFTSAYIKGLGFNFIRRLAILIVFGLLTKDIIAQPCDPFPIWETSDYVLPYPVGKTYAVVQGNCSGFGHSGFYQHGYDYALPIGDDVTASRAGVVFQIRDGFQNGDLVPGHSNWVKIIHEDNTISAYSHLSPGIPVAVGDEIEAGQVIGKGGNTGNTGGFPHLHFHVSTCSEPTDGCGTEPITFRNTRPNPNGLDSGSSYMDLSETYTALSYSSENGPSIDDDGDGVTNLVESAFGMNIHVPDTHKLPKLAIEGNKIRLPFIKNRADLLYILESSVDLIEWQEEMPILKETQFGPGIEALYTFPTNEVHFIRLRLKQ